MKTFYSTVQQLLIEAGFVIRKEASTGFWVLLDATDNEQALLSARQLGELLYKAEKEMGL